jgi:hypothetical protein
MLTVGPMMVVSESVDLERLLKSLLLSKRCKYVTVGRQDGSSRAHPCTVGTHTNFNYAGRVTDDTDHERCNLSLPHSCRHRPISKCTQVMRMACSCHRQRPSHIFVVSADHA